MPKTDKPMNVSTTITLSPELYAAIAALQKAEDRSFNKVVNRLLRDAVGHEQDSAFTNEITRLIALTEAPTGER